MEDGEDVSTGNWFRFALCLSTQAQSQHSYPLGRCGTVRRRYYTDEEKEMAALQGSVDRKHHIPVKAKIFAGFFPRTGGDLVVAYGEHTKYPGKFTSARALEIFRNEATAREGHRIKGLRVSSVCLLRSVCALGALANCGSYLGLYFA